MEHRFIGMAMTMREIEGLTDIISKRNLNLGDLIRNTDTAFPLEMQVVTSAFPEKRTKTVEIIVKFGSIYKGIVPFTWHFNGVIININTEFEARFCFGGGLLGEKGFGRASFVRKT